MKLRSGQKGITLWGIMAISVVAIFFLLLFFKLFPAYMEDLQASSAIDAFAESPGAKTLEPSDVINAIEKRLDIEGVKNLKPQKDIAIVPAGNAYAIEANYLVEIPFVGNISILLYFDHRAVVR
jgi:hypothetical protein